MKRISVAVLGVGLVAFACLLISDLYDVAVRHTDYNFGSEAMIGNGGWFYRSARTYVASEAIQVILSAFAAFGFFLYAFGRKRLILASAAAAVAMVLFNLSAAIIH